jgi:hypothetical protein
MFENNPSAISTRPISICVVKSILLAGNNVTLALRPERRGMKEFGQYHRGDVVGRRDAKLPLRAGGFEMLRPDCTLNNHKRIPYERRHS